VEGKYLCKPNTLRDEADIDTLCLTQRNVHVSVNAPYVVHIYTYIMSFIFIIITYIAEKVYVLCF